METFERFSMKVKIITSLNTKLYYKYGEKMIQSFLSKWPENYELAIYYDDDHEMIFDHLNKVERIKTYNLNLYTPDLIDFINRHKDRPDQQNPLELHLGAVRFAYKTFSIIHGTTKNDCDLAVWLDADVVTHTTIPENFIENLHPSNSHVSYLGRANNYSECGFVIYNTQHPYHKEFMDVWRRMYTTDEVFKLPQWHDSYVFDCIRIALEKQYNIINNNLTPWGKDYDHVFINSMLGDYMDHLKGDRKASGKSKQSDLIKDKSTVEYWK